MSISENGYALNPYYGYAASSYSAFNTSYGALYQNSAHSLAGAYAGPPYPCITKGARDSATGGAVTALQNALEQHGSGRFNNTGEFNNSTFLYLQKFQQSKGLSPDGIAGPQTWQALGLSGSPCGSTAVAASSRAPGSSPATNSASGQPFYKKSWFMPAVATVSGLTLISVIFLAKRRS